MTSLIVDNFADTDDYHQRKSYCRGEGTLREVRTQFPSKSR